MKQMKAHGNKQMLGGAAVLYFYDCINRNCGKKIAGNKIISIQKEGKILKKCPYCNSMVRKGEVMGADGDNVGSNAKE